MNKLRRFSISLAALLLFSGIAMVSPAAARDGNSSSDTSNSSTKDTVAVDDTATNNNSTGGNLAEQFREQAKEQLQAARQNAKEQSEAHREQACNARKANLTNRMANSVRHAQKLKGVMDSFFTRVQDFYTSKNLNVSNYDTLKSDVVTAQTNAANSITALQALNTDGIDCTSSTVADSVSAFRKAVSNTRDSLKAYRKSLVALITALKGASTGTGGNSSDNSTDSTTNTTGQ
jgi:hypothetical protein